MTPERWKQVRLLFEAVTDLPEDQRDDYLDIECAGDTELRDIVKKLAASSELAETFLETPAAEAETVFKDNDTGFAKSTTGGIEKSSFVSGTILGERYRIVGLIGKGGMGEVYKAEDLKLDQTVALKFLPDKLERNKEALQRFIGEVRIARQVSHPNVCRVFDIGDIDGRHYISMEFIDGDDLSVLLQRIGRLPSDKASQISRQICFGLHAIHDAGILHRDLKPANIIIDRVGKARITDFGIAGFDSDFKDEEIRVGTPAYMSPEQITGKEVTVKSDIYSLGLLIYEIFTGTQAFTADSFEALIEKQKTTSPRNASTLVENIEPIVEKTINRCLEKDPADRPDSVMQVALALPGGNPLEAAIMAGETPSPEMVAAAPRKGSMSPFAAMGTLAIFFAATFSLLALNQRWLAYAFTPFEKSPEVLAEKSREILKTLGFSEVQADTHYEFVQDTRFLDYYGLPGNKHGLPPRKEMLKTGQPFDTFFLYRQSPGYMEPVDSVAITETEPPLAVPNMVALKLDAKGRLIELVVIPAETPSNEKRAAIDWHSVFRQAGLDLNKFTESEAKWTPPVFTDLRRTWTGQMTDFPEIPIRVETGAFDGRPVYFRVVAPWHSPSNAQAADENPFITTGTALLIFAIAAAILASFFIAYRNIRSGRGDVRGGLKLTSFLFLVALAGQILIASHVPTIWGELSVLYEAISYAGITAASVGLIYIALEPFVRRSWSEILISWSRLMAGDFKDPMVGRDVLVGGLMGLGHLVGIQVGILILQGSLGSSDIVMSFYKLEPLNSMSGFTGMLLDNVVSNTAFGLVVVFIAFFFFVITGKKFLGIAAIGLLFFILQWLIVISTLDALMLFGSVINSVCLMYSLGRHGLLGVISFWVFFEAIYLYPVTFDSSAFFFPQSLANVIFILGVASYAAYVSIAGRSLLGERFSSAL